MREFFNVCCILTHHRWDRKYIDSASKGGGLTNKPIPRGFPAVGGGINHSHYDLAPNFYPVLSLLCPFTIRKRSGRKLVITLDRTAVSPQSHPRVDGTLLKALARGFKRQKMLREGGYQMLEEIAEAENINPSYVSRVLRQSFK